MKRNNKGKSQNGITLVALVVTVVVLLILAGVTITYVFSDNGILSQAQTAANKTDAATVLEEIQSRLLAIQLGNTDAWTYTNTDVIDAIKDVTGVDVDEWDDEFYTENGNEVEISSLWVGIRPISITDSFVGYYADVDGNGTVDGVIFADLMNVQRYNYWYLSSRGSYSWTVLTKADGVKKYYVSQESYTDDFGTMAVISPVEGTSGKDRFYVMALDDLSGYFYWYYSASSSGMDDYETATSSDFGSGYKNTGTMITYWINGTYGTQTSSDVWGSGLVQTGFAGGWFVPSSGELSAFLAELEVSSVGYSSYSLSTLYWSSTQYSSTRALLFGPSGRIDVVDVGRRYSSSTEWYHVRLATTF